MDKKYLQFVEGMTPIIKGAETIWFYSNDFVETKIFTNCAELDRYCKSEYMIVGRNILYYKGFNVGITNNIENIENPSRIYLDKTIDIKRILLKAEENRKHVYYEVNDLFVPTIKNIKIVCEYNEQ